VENDMTLRTVVTMALAAAVLALPGRVHAEPTVVPVQGGSLSLDRPSDWKASVSGPAFGPPLRLTPAKGDAFVIQITAMVSRKELPNDEALSQRVRQQGESHLPTALQTKVDLLPVKGAEAQGYVYHLTDKTPENGPGTFRELRQGAIVVPPLLLSVTILTHTGDTATVKSALAALTGARYRAAPK
jgi:hypothetical protein